MVENSDGAHNSALAQDTLNKSEAAVDQAWHRSKRNATGLSAALGKGRRLLSLPGVLHQNSAATGVPHTEIGGKTG